MRITLRKMFALLLCLCLFLSFAPISLAKDIYIMSASDTSGSEYTDNSTLAAKLDNIFAGNVEFYTKQSDGEPESKYLALAPLGDSTTVNTTKYIYIKNIGKWASGSTCFIYASAVYNSLFGDSPLSPADGSDMHSVKIIDNSRKLSGSELYQQFQNAGAKTGAFMQTSNNGTSHSMILLSYNEKTISYLAGNDDGNGLIRIAVKDWDSFNNFTKNRYLRRVYQPTDEWYNKMITPTPAQQYIDQCTSEPCNVTLTVTNTGNMKNMPCSVNTNAQSETVEKLELNHTYSSNRYYTNTVGHIWYEVTSSTGKRGFIYSGDVSVNNITSTLSVKGHEAGTPSGILTPGSNFGLRGIISSNYTITRVEAHIYDVNGKDVVNHPAYIKNWNSNSYNIQTDGINSHFTFGDLDGGTDGIKYRYVVAAADASEQVMHILIDSWFTVGASSQSDFTNTWKNTGDMAVDLAEVAYTQIGYRETGTNHTKYNQWYYGNDTSAAWCAIFISWCANQAGIPQSIIHRTNHAYPGSDDFNIPYYSFASAQPAKGDLVFVENNGKLNYGDVYGFDHVGIVYSVDSSYIYTIEGNDNDQVTYNKYIRSTGVDSEKSSAYIVWIGKPNYSGSQPVQTASTLNISGYSGKPGTPGTAGALVQGENYGLRGIISSNYTITQVNAHIYNSSGADAISPYSTSWNSTNYNIQTDGINNHFSFRNLPTDSYRYVVSATDASGETRTLINSSFEIGQTSQPIIIPSGTVSEKLASILAEYPDGSSWTQTFDGSKKSYGFAGLVIYKIFGNSTVSGKTYRWWNYAGVSTSGMQAISEVASCTESNVKNLLSMARPGDVLQFDQGTSSGTQFSMIVYSLTDSGANIYDCNLNGDDIVRLHHLSYSDFVTLQGTGPKGKLTLLRSDNYDEIEPPVQTTILDLNGYLDSVSTGSLEGFGTVDIYINGNLAASNVGDYCESLPVGTTYEVRNIQAFDGRLYNGVHSGTLSGTIGTEQVNVVLSFSTLVHLNMDGYLDGDAKGGLDKHGIADVYVNGSLVANGCTDYWAAWPVGTTYEIKNIRANDGYRYNGVYSGSLSGTIGKEQVNVILSFSTVHRYSFDANGDFGTMASIQATLGNPVGFPASTFTRDGYNFQGWNAYRVNDGKFHTSVGWRTPDEIASDRLEKSLYLDQIRFDFDATWTTDTSGPCDFIMYAVWTPNTYTLTYNANGGTGAPETQSKTQDVLLTLSTDAPTRAGYYFLGWAESADAVEAAYQPGAVFSRNADTTLYAVWQKATPDFVLPAALTTIDTEAFEGGAFRYVHLPDGVTRIERRAFADCPNLRDVDIPCSATSISPTAFEGASDLTIHGEDGSFAEFYAQKYGFGFIPVA